LIPTAAGQAKVESKRGAPEIEVEFSGLDRPTSFGNEYLTYVLWAISPECRQVNIGEVLVGDNHRSKLDVITDLQAWALIVTAEPYYAGKTWRILRSDTSFWLTISVKYQNIARMYLTI
jgi:hypothetical protein